MSAAGVAPSILHQKIISFRALKPTSPCQHRKKKTNNLTHLNWISLGLKYISFIRQISQNRPFLQRKKLKKGRLQKQVYRRGKQRTTEAHACRRIRKRKASQPQSTSSSCKKVADAASSHRRRVHVRRRPAIRDCQNGRHRRLRSLGPLKLSLLLSLSLSLAPCSARSRKPNIKHAPVRPHAVTFRPQAPTHCVILSSLSLARSLSDRFYSWSSTLTLAEEARE